MAGDPIAAALEALQNEATAKPVRVSELRPYIAAVRSLRDRYTLADLADQMTQIFGRPVHQHTLVNLIRPDRQRP